MIALSGCKRSSPATSASAIKLITATEASEDRLSSFRRSSKSGLSDDSDDDQRDFHDLTPRPSVGGRRRSSLLMRRLSSISGRRSSNYSSHSSGVGGNDSSGRRSSAVNRKSSLDLFKGSGGEYRPRSEHPLLTHAEDE